MKTLAQYHNALFATVADGAVTIDTSLVSSGWSQPIPGILVSDVYFDLAGLSLEDKTIFIEASGVQHGAYPAIGGQAGDNYLLVDIMTSIPIDVTDPAFLNLGLVGLGFPESKLNFEHVIYQRYRRYTLDLDAGARMAILASDDQSGSNKPTASDRIYCYRVVIPDLSQSPGTLVSFNVPPARYLLEVNAVEEPTYQHIMRLKRSYDLQQSFDRD